MENQKLYEVNGRLTDQGIDALANIIAACFGQDHNPKEWGEAGQRFALSCCYLFNEKPISAKDIHKAACLASSRLMSTNI